jgi:hypothetical protein
MVHLIFIVVLAGWHNLLLLARITISKPDLNAGPGERDHLTPSNTSSLNTFERSTNPIWENPTAAFAYILKSATKTSPETIPSAPPYYLGRKTIFLMKKQRVTLLQMGGDLWYPTKPRTKEFYEQQTKPYPPPAPNIGSPHQPDILPSNRALNLAGMQPPHKKIPRQGTE